MPGWLVVALSGLALGLAAAVALYTLTTNRWPWDQGDR